MFRILLSIMFRYLETELTHSMPLPVAAYHTSFAILDTTVPCRLTPGPTMLNMASPPLLNIPVPAA